MLKKFIVPLMITILMALLNSGSAFAGGWAVVSLDELPSQIYVDQPVIVRFMVRQHGVKPVSGIDTMIVATHSKSGEIMSFAGKSLREDGLYTAELVFPISGEWQWKIEAFGRIHSMPALTVSAPSDNPSVDNSVWIRLAGFGITFALGLFVWRQNGARAGILTAVILAGGMAGLAFAFFAPGGPPPSGETKIPINADYGIALFQAKGCITCHTHAAVEASLTQSLNIGPNLSQFSAAEVYLQDWLADPASIKPGTNMPDLGLTPMEIDALIAFLNQE